MKLKDLVKGKEAKKILLYLLNTYEGEGNYREYEVAGYYKEGGWFYCFDNLNKCCYVEQTRFLLVARRWCYDEVEVDELYSPRWNK